MLLTLSLPFTSSLLLLSIPSSSQFSSPIMSQLTPLPAPWYIFFGLLEPVSTLAGAYFALLDTDGFYRDLIPLEMKGSAAAFVKGVVGEATGGALLSGKPSDEARMGLAQLGSCEYGATRYAE